MKERPIIFSTPMVQAILNTMPNVWPPQPIDPAKPFKWQTRRLVIPRQTKPRIPPRFMEPWLIDSEQQTYDDGRPLWVGFHTDYPTGEKWFCCDYGQPADQLYVRETWRPCQAPAHYDPSSCVEYVATPNCMHGHWGTTYRRGWKSPRFMPKWASRIQLEIKNVRVERVQDISEADAVAEGFRFNPEWKWRPLGSKEPSQPVDGRKWFANTWDALNDKRAPWSDNPWVWVIEFMPIRATQ